MGHSFEGDERFSEARRDGFDYFINFKENRTTRLLAAYTDYLLRNYDRVRIFKWCRRKFLLKTILDGWTSIGKGLGTRNCFIQVRCFLYIDISGYLCFSSCRYLRGKRIATLMIYWWYLPRMWKGKDFFQALYRRDLSKRLLLDMKSRNAEKNMLTKLRKGSNVVFGKSHTV